MKYCFLILGYVFCQVAQGGTLTLMSGDFAVSIPSDVTAYKIVSQKSDKFLLLKTGSNELCGIPVKLLKEFNMSPLQLGEKMIGTSGLALECSVKKDQLDTSVRTAHKIQLGRQI